MPWRGGRKRSRRTAESQVACIPTLQSAGRQAMEPGGRVATFMRMDTKPFAESVNILLGQRPIAVGSTQQAAGLLLDVDWPERGPRHREATEACLKVLEGYRSTEDARSAFIEAAREAAVLE